MPGGGHPCPACAAPLVREAGGARFVCSRLSEGCFETLPAAGDRPFDVTPHDGPEAAERLILAKEGCLKLAAVAQDAGALNREDYYAAVGAILDTESLLRLGRLRRRLDQRLADRGKAP